MNMIGSLLGHSWTNITQIYADENWEQRKKATSKIEKLVADTAGTYWHTGQNGANEQAVKQVSNA